MQCADSFHTETVRYTHSETLTRHRHRELVLLCCKKADMKLCATKAFWALTSLICMTKSMGRT